MAASFTKVRGTPHSLVLRITGDNVQATYPWISLVSNAAAGPLQTLLAKYAATPANFAELNAAGSKIRIYRSAKLDTVNLLPTSSYAVFTVDGLEANVINSASDAEDEIELRYLHSAAR